jgi:hypothetical protein
MPLRAVLDRNDIQAFDYDPDSWDALKRTYRHQELVTACCGRKAIPKSSTLGTQFFAHARRGDCTSAPETKEHLLAKSIIARAAKAAGWRVTTEAPGKSRDDDTWIADVLAERSNARIALEAQWSPQSHREYRYRQERYAASGVRAAWFVRRLPKDERGWGAAESTKELPIFELLSTADGRDFTVTPFHLSLRAFVTGMLRGDLHWGPQAGYQYDLRGVLADDDCWRCRRSTTILIGITVHHPRCGEIGYVSASDAGVLGRFMREVDPDVLKRLGLGVIKRRYSRTAEDTYLSQGCAHCDALLGSFFIQELESELFSADELTPGPFLTRTALTGRQARLLRPAWHFAGATKHRATLD